MGNDCGQGGDANFFEFHGGIRFHFAPMLPMEGFPGVMLMEPNSFCRASSYVSCPSGYIESSESAQMINPVGNRFIHRQGSNRFRIWFLP